MVSQSQRTSGASLVRCRVYSSHDSDSSEKATSLGKSPGLFPLCLLCPCILFAPVTNLVGALAVHAQPMRQQDQQLVPTLLQETAGVPVLVHTHRLASYLARTCGQC